MKPFTELTTTDLETAHGIEGKEIESWDSERNNKTQKLQLSRIRVSLWLGENIRVFKINI